MNKVIVVGSINMDITARTDKLPDTGETVTARSVEYLPGGKGLNQAVAAAKIGTTVVLAGCLGSDSFADELASFIRRHKIDVSCLRRSEKNSGIALITRPRQQCRRVPGKRQKTACRPRRRRRLSV